MKHLTNLKERQILINHLRLSILWPFLAFLVCLNMGLNDLSAHEVKNENTGQEYSDLTIAIAAANPGDTLKLKGTFTGNFVIAQSLTLIGHHHATLDGNQSGTVLIVTGNATVVNLEHLTFQNGLSTTNPGGGIFNNAVTINLKHVEILHNIATVGGGIGSIAGTFTLDECKIHNNTSDEVGGGIVSFGGNNVISDTSISFNAAGLGGGLYNASGPNGPSVTSLNKVKLEGNFAAVSGGGIANVEASVLNVIESKIKENSAQQFGGGLYNAEDAIANFNDSKIIENNVVTPNGGGGIYSSGATFNLADTEVEHNIPNDITEA
jgi:hypothetical protein